MKNGTEETGEAMVLAPQDGWTLAVARAPEAVLDEAHKAAAALKKVIDSKKKKLTFNGKTYLEFEDWLTVGRFYGVTARIREVKHVQFGEAQGFEAFAEAIMVGSGQIVSAADAMCLNDEPNWSRKPLFQLRSMAQTRACAKAMRNVLAWVVVLAGYAPTPAEEMDGHTQAAPLPATPKAPKPQPASNQAQAGDFLRMNVSEAHKAHTKGGKEYFWVKDGEKSLPCFDLELYDTFVGLQGENVTVELGKGNKGPFIKGIADAELPPPPARSLEVTNEDIPF